MRILLGIGTAAHIVIGGLLHPQAFAQFPSPPKVLRGRTATSAVAATTHMVVVANPLAVDAGIQILRRGGSAVDAAIAVQLVLNLTEPQSSGIGGGAFLVYYSAEDKKLTTYDGRETAPAAARPDRFLGPDGRPLPDAAIGGRSVGVPGLLRMLQLAHAAHGRLPWDTLFQPAIALAEPVANRIQPGKRPRSAMSPSLVFDRDGRLVMVVGSPGGSAIVNYVAKTLVGVLDWGLDIQQAIDLPNFGSRGGATELERGMGIEGVKSGLEAMGHAVRLLESASGLHGILVIAGGYVGGADSRREGVARGD